MGFDLQNQEIIRHLKALKQADTEYPPELFAARRRLFLKRMGEISLGIGAGEGIRQALKTPQASPKIPITSKVLETVLLIAILAEAGAVAYLYRDKLSEALKSFVASGEVQEIISPPVFTISPFSFTATLSTSTPEHTLTPALDRSPTPQSVIVSEAPAAVLVPPTQTSVPGIVDPVNSVNATAIQSNSTPDPNGNNGNHYGQTPKPERTKENNGNGGGSGNGSGNGGGNGNGNGNGNRP